MLILKNNVHTVIFDWAGTAVDYGCFAPLEVFIKVFSKKGIQITIEEAREPMGLKKIDHIKALTKMKRIDELWKQKYGQRADQTDIEEIYDDFEKSLLEILDKYADPIPGIIETVAELREKGIKIGSTTGYTSEMMKIVSAESAKKGYEPDSIVSSTDTAEGRPKPFMIYKNALNLAVYPMSRILKVGDTISDIKEGLNAEVWTAAVVMGSSELGLTKKEAADMDSKKLESMIYSVTKKFKDAGAHYVLEDIKEVTAAVNDINSRLKAGELPNE